MKRTTFVAAIMAAVLLPAIASAQADWPAKPMTYIVPYPPGGLNDAVGRVYAEKLSAELGKTVIVDNKAGAATTVASNFVAKANPDGYTLYGGGTSLVINPTLTGNVQYDPHKSFDLVSLMSFTPFILHVHADFPAKNMAELIAVVKANPGKFNIASSGVGATNHLAAELFKAQTGLKLVHVPYKGGAQAGQDLAAGQAQMMFSASLEAKPLLTAGKTRAIAISSLKRSPAFPDIPTAMESGLSGFEVTSWYGLWVPAGTPASVVRKLHDTVVKAFADPELKDTWAKLGAEPGGSSPEAFRALIDTDIAKWGKVVREAKITLE